MESRARACEAAGSILTTTASLVSSAVLAGAVINNFFPPKLQTFISSHLQPLRSFFSPEHSIIIHESDTSSSPHQYLFLSCTTYLGSIISSSTSRFIATKNRDAAAITFGLQEGQVLIDVFHGIEFRWRLLPGKFYKTLYIQGLPNRAPKPMQYFELCFHKNHKNAALGSYLHHVMRESDRIRATERSLKIHANNISSWHQVELLHPATFETLAMESDLKQRIVEDLSRFSISEAYYKQKGKPWMRSYLIYGPPGTGKTSLIVAMAKFLRMDIYDMDIKALPSISALKALLLCISKRSMLVVEDIDGLMMNDPAGNGDKGGRGGSGDISLSAVLSYVDMLWSSEGEDRVLVFTARKKEVVEHPLLRSGRIDMCWQMTYCGPPALKALLLNYHGIDEHRRLGEIEELVKEVEVSPAEVGEELMRSDDVDAALKGLAEFLHRRRSERDAGERRRGDEIDAVYRGRGRLTGLRGRGRGCGRGRRRR